MIDFIRINVKRWWRRTLVESSYCQQLLLSSSCCTFISATIVQTFCHRPVTVFCAWYVVKAVFNRVVVCFHLDLATVRYSAGPPTVTAPYRQMAGNNNGCTDMSGTVVV